MVNNTSEVKGVKVRVISQHGHCGSGHKVGDEWVMNRETPAGICLPAFNAILLDARAIMYGGDFPWTSNSDTAIVTCPDPNNPVVFEIRRLNSEYTE